MDRIAAYVFVYRMKIRFILEKIYPKTGTDGTDNLEKKEYKIIAEQISKAIQENKLYIIDVRKQTLTLKENL